MSLTGKVEERAFEIAVRQFYRGGVDIQRLQDSFDAGRLVAPRPSDFLLVFSKSVVHRFQVCYVEVKSTSNTKSWAFKKQLSDSQWTGMRRASTLGHEYFVALAMKDDWYLLPSTFLLNLLLLGKASLKPTDIQQYHWNAFKGNLHVNFQP